MTPLRMGDRCSPLALPGDGATVVKVEARPGPYRAITIRSDGGVEAVILVARSEADLPATIMEADGEEWPVPIARACPTCARWTVRQIPPRALARLRAAHPEDQDTSHVCHPGEGGCNQGFALDPLPAGFQGFAAEDLFDAVEAPTVRTEDQVRRDMTAGLLEVLEAGDVVEVGGWRGVVLPCSRGVSVWVTKAGTRGRKAYRLEVRADGRIDVRHVVGGALDQPVGDPVASGVLISRGARPDLARRQP